MVECATTPDAEPNNGEQVCKRSKTTGSASAEAEAEEVRAQSAGSPVGDLDEFWGLIITKLRHKVLNKTSVTPRSHGPWEGGYGEPRLMFH